MSDVVTLCRMGLLPDAIAVVAQVRDPGGDNVSKETLALITGFSAVVGALVGGGVAGWANLKGQSSRQQFDREERIAAERRHDALRAVEVRGVAREMRGQFKVNRHIYRSHIGLKFWWNSEIPMPGLFERESDRVAIAAVLTHDEWDSIESAEYAFREVESTREFSRSRAPEVMQDRDDADVGKSINSFVWHADLLGHDRDAGVQLVTDAIEHAAKLTDAAIAALDPYC